MKFKSFVARLVAGEVLAGLFQLLDRNGDPAAELDSTPTAYTENPWAALAMYDTDTPNTVGRLSWGFPWYALGSAKDAVRLDISDSVATALRAFLELRMSNAANDAAQALLFAYASSTCYGRVQIESDLFSNDTATVTIGAQGANGDDASITVSGEAGVGSTIGLNGDAVQVNGIDIAGQWSTYTPTLTQSNTVTKTVTRARYKQIGKTVFLQVDLAITAAGTAANSVLISLPVTAKSSGHPVAGAGYITDSSVTLNHGGAPYLNSTTALGLHPITATGSGYGLLGSVGFTAAVANGDGFHVGAVYEAA